MCARLRLLVTKEQLERLNKSIQEVLDIIQNPNAAPTEQASNYCN